ncbi:MAG: InlB B-repeat-containing protein [Lachnospiraceae bacterium]|nr:InlB B-repeat-containing protein [Lachnospiraceae bacterium]
MVCERQRNRVWGIIFRCVMLLVMTVAIVWLFRAETFAENTESVQITESTFPDPAFREYVRKFDKDGNGWLDYDERKQVTYIGLYQKGVTDITGVEVFEYLDYLDAPNLEVPFDMTAHPEMDILYLSDCSLESLDLSHYPKLYSASLSGDRLATVILGEKKELTSFQCYGTLTEIDFSKANNLERIVVGCNDNLVKLTLGSQPKLKYLDAQGNKLTKLDLTGCTALEHLDLHINELTQINLDNCKNLTELHLASNPIDQLDVSQLRNLKILTIGGFGNKVNSLKVPETLQELQLYDCSADELDFTKLRQLTKLVIQQTVISNLDLRNCSDLDYVYLGSGAKIDSLLITAPKLTRFEWYYASAKNSKELDLSASGALKRLSFSGVGSAKFTVYLAPGVADSLTECSVPNGVQLVEKNVKVLSFELNGGDSGKPVAIAATPGSAVTIPKSSPVRPLYYFLGWSTDPKATTATYKSGNSVTLSDNVTLYAVWKKSATATLHFDKNNFYASAKVPEDIEVVRGAAAVIPRMVPNGVNYYFLGWSVDPKASTATYKSGDTITMSSDLTLYGVWKPGVINVSFDINGATGETPATIRFSGKSPATFTLPEINATRKGYKFVTWQLNNTNRQRLPGQQDSVYWDRTYSAIWELREYSVTYHLDGGTNHPDNPSTYTINSHVVLKAPTKAGYTFAGWYTDAAMTKRSSGIAVGSISNRVFYAKFVEAANVSLNFNLNGGKSGAPAAITVKSGSSVTVPKSSPVRSGYWFLGWSDSKTATSVKYKGDSVLTLTKNTTLYAVWSLRTYKITYHLDGGTNHPDNPATYKITSPALYLKAPTKAGYRFVGWYTDAAMTKKSSGVAPGSIMDREFYAKFEKIQ